MPPPPAPKRIKRPAIVLDEDTYTSAISHIIRRDFFPGLAETDAQHEYLDALESGDRGWIREAGERVVQAMTPVPGRKRRDLGRRTPLARADGDGGRTPSVWGADTPVPLVPEVGEDQEDSKDKKPDVDLSLSLTAFQAKYTSEDQESFSRILDAANAKKFEKNKWLHNGNAYASKQRVAQQRVLEAASSSDKDKQVALRPSRDLDDRPAAPTTHKHTAFNSLMFPPESVEDWAPTKAKRAEEASLAPPKQVLYNNTRLPPAPDPSDLPARPGSPTMSAVRDAISGKPRLSASEAYSGSETPRVNGYAFVDARAPSPEEEEEEPPTDLLERLGANSENMKTNFKINAPDRREMLHLKMVDKINSKDKSGPGASATGKGIFRGMDTPRFLSAPTPGGRPPVAGGMTPGRKAPGDLTPAGRMLLSKVGGGAAKMAGSSGFASSGSRARDWTPITPRVKRRG
jgi:protein DGCR14